MWGPSSLTRDRTHIPCIARWILNHRATKEIPFLPSFSFLFFFLNFLTFFLVLPHKHSILSATKSSHVYRRWLNFTHMHLFICCLCQGESLHGGPSSPASSITLSRQPAQITTTPITCLGASQGFHWPLFLRWCHVPGQGALFCWRKYHHFHSDT